MRRSRSKVVGDWQVPQRPKHAKEKARPKNASIRFHDRKGIAHPPDLLTQSGEKPKQNSQRKEIGSEILRERLPKRQQDQRDERRWNQKRRVPAYSDSPASHSREEISKAPSAADHARKQNAG